MSVRVVFSTAGEQDVFVIGEGVTGEAFELEDEQVHWFPDSLTRLTKGVNGLAVIDESCFPIVTGEYFQQGRASVASVRQIDRSVGIVPEKTGARRFFVFGVPGATGFQFALSLNQVLEVSRALPMASLHFEHSHMAGVAVWRGETIPVVDVALAAKLGELRDGEWNRMIIVRSSSNQIFAIPACGQVRQHGAGSQVYAPDSGPVRPMRGIRGVFRYEGSPLLVPDLDALAC